MAQFNWTYLGENGQKYNVGVFHGPKTGHVLVFCNLKVVLVDFSVLDTKEYSLFLGDELCQLKLDRRGDKFFYDMNVDKDADTPLNRQRKARDKKHWKQSIVFFSAMLLCIFTFTSLVIYNHSPEEERRMQNRANLLSSPSQYALGTITKIEAEKIYYQYIVNGKWFTGNIKKELIQPENNGMPVEVGDEFSTQFALDNPLIHQIDFNLPSQKQLQVYFKRAFEKQVAHHPEFSAQKVQCMIEVAYELEGLPVFADFYFQDLSPEENVLHNNFTYKRLVRDQPFVNVMANRCI